nr:ABC transporter transmembrane domain-containing protein [Sporosalibacterium faouarense]
MKSLIFIRILTGTIYVAAIAAIPYIIKMLIDYDFSKGSKGVIIFISMYLLAAGVGMGFQYISQLHEWKIVRKFYLLIKRDIFDSILGYSYTKFSKSKLSTYVSILDNDVPVVKQYLDSGIMIVQSAIQVIVYGIYMFMLDPRIAIIIILCSSLSLFLPNVTSKTLSQRRANHLGAVSLYIGKVHDLLQGFKNVNYQTKDNILSEHNRTMTETEDKLLHYGRFSTFTNVFNGSFMYLLDISAFVTIAVLLLKNTITIGTATATLAYIKEFVYPVRYIVSDLSTMKSAKSTKDKLLDFMKDDEKALPKLSECNHTIEFSKVSVKFENLKLRILIIPLKKGKNMQLWDIVDQVNQQLLIY